tara:strand:- start:395 stop:652 length:258 start_codon:yes stop_codon:yes gene_type:complete
MPSFYFQSIDSNGVTTTKSFDSNYIDEVVDNVDDFLRGSGFAYDELQLVKTITPYDELEEEPTIYDFNNPRVLAELKAKANEEDN